MEIVQEHFIQVGPKNPAGTPGALDGFSLKFKFDDTKYNADNLELCYTAEPATGNQSVEPPIRQKAAGVLVTDEVMKSEIFFSDGEA